MDLKKVKKIIFRSKTDNCITDYVTNRDGDCMGFEFYAFAIYDGGKYEKLNMVHYYKNFMFELLKNSKKEEYEEWENDPYDSYVDFDNFELDDYFEGKFIDEDFAIIDGAKIPCDVVDYDFDIDDFFEEL